VSFIPERIALTRAMLSFLVRPETEGTVIVRSIPPAVSVMPDGVPEAAAPATATVEEIAGESTASVTEEGPLSGICSTPEEGFASLLAQAGITRRRAARHGTTDDIAGGIKMGG
jgi:hypothetical protein